ncbi:MAG: hypothetical protein H6828_13060 [Planctomycetes bacterium]|nr:hypothetical protein [Planctomycetota bacterium]
MKATSLFVAFVATSAFTVAAAQGSDDCSTATLIAGQGGFAFDNLTATTGTQGQVEAICLFFGNSGINNDIWFDWTADITGDATVSLCGNTLDTKLATWPGGGCPADGTSLACNDDSCSLQSELTFPVTAGTSYMIQLGTFSASAHGTGTMNISIVAPPDPNDCATAPSIAGQGLFAFDNSAATTGLEGQTEANCLFFGSSAIDNDLWYSWTADITGTATIQTCAQTGVDTKMAVYPGGGCPSAGSSLACNDDSCSLQSSVSLAVTAGTSYMIQLGTFPGSAGGTGNLDISIVPPSAPAQDDCATPTVIAGDGLFAFDNNLCTTGTEGQIEANCLFFGNSGINNDIWFSWTAPASGTAVIGVCGQTSLDTKIAAYPGGGCPVDGSSLACNDDSCSLQSELSLAVTAGTSYMIQLGTFSATAFGTGNLSIKTFTGTNDHCSTPDAIAGQGSFALDLSANTTGLEGQSEPTCFFFGQSAIHKDAWFAWTADVTGDATVSTCNASFDTKIAAYDGGGCPAAPAIACNDDSCSLQSSMTFPVVAGTTYTLQIGTFSETTTVSAASFDISINPAPPGTAYCFCDGTASVTAPCGNAGAAGNGCGNSANAAGANLDGAGDAVVGSDTVVLTATGLPSTAFCLIFQGDNNNEAVFGDGIKCAGGTMVRMGTMQAVGGSVDTASMGVTVSVKGGVTAGDLRYYQGWYRDAAGPCGNFFNTTNGYEIQW